MGHLGCGCTLGDLACETCLADTTPQTRLEIGGKRQPSERATAQSVLKIRSPTPTSSHSESLMCPGHKVGETQRVDVDAARVWGLICSLVTVDPLSKIPHPQTTKHCTAAEYSRRVDVTCVIPSPLSNSHPVVLPTAQRPDHNAQN